MSNAKPLRVAVVGVGQFGANHCRVVSQSSRGTLAAVVDTDPKRAAAAASQYGCLSFNDVRDLRGKADAAIVAVPTTQHTAIGCKLLDAGFDLLVEKPIAPDLASADRLAAAAARTKRILQIGHLERFNPAVVALETRTTVPLFFEIHRMSVFSPRSLDVDVILDLMIHDLDILLSLVSRPIDEIRAAGISILSKKVDIANVRLQFRGGIIANLTASRVSTDKVRKLRLFQPGQYLSVDYARQDLAVFSVDEGRQIGFEQAPVEKGEPLKLQFDAFLDSIETRKEPKTSGAAARRTLEVALAILDKIEEHSAIVSETLESGWKPQ